MSQIHLQRGDEQFGPYTTEEVAAMYESGQLYQGDLLYEGSRGDWCSVEQFFAIKQAAPPTVKRMAPPIGAINSRPTTSITPENPKRKFRAELFLIGCVITGWYCFSLFSETKNINMDWPRLDPIGKILIGLLLLILGAFCLAGLGLAFSRNLARIVLMNLTIVLFIFYPILYYASEAAIAAAHDHYNTQVYHLPPGTIDSLSTQRVLERTHQIHARTGLIYLVELLVLLGVFLYLRTRRVKEACGILVPPRLNR